MNPQLMSDWSLTWCFLCVPVEAAGGKALACVVDIRDEQQIGEAVQKAVDKFGGKKTVVRVSKREWERESWYVKTSWSGSTLSHCLFMTDRYRHSGEQRKCHQSDRNSGDAHEEGRPDAGD